MQNTNGPQHLAQTNGGRCRYCGRKWMGGLPCCNTRFLVVCEGMSQAEFHHRRHNPHRGVNKRKAGKQARKRYWSFLRFENERRREIAR